MVKSYKLKWRKYFKVAWVKLDGVQKHYYKGGRKYRKAVAK